MTNLANFIQSIVTSYTSYILDSAAEILGSVGPTKTTKALWLAALHTLRNSFEHDQDGSF